MPTKVDDALPEIAARRAEWMMLDALMAGTGAMRRGAEHFLPRFPQEDPEAWAARVKRSTLFPAYKRTVKVMAGKPFSTELTLSKDTPAQIEEWAKDIDMEGVSLHVFAAEMFEESFSGLAGILVETPRAVAPAANRPATVAEQKAAGARPYWVRIKHDQLLGWTVRTVNGQRSLLQLRYREWVEEPDGEFGNAKVEQIRVLDPGRWRTYRRPDASTTADFVLHETGQTGLDTILFAPVYGRRVSFMCGEAPLVDLAYMNVKHWQSQSDQDNILHVIRVPVLFAKGFGDEEQIVIGANLAVKAGNPSAELKWVEHTGSAADTGQKSLEALEEQMIQAGAELMVNRATGRKTATEDANDAEANKCDLQRQAEDYEDTLNLALAYTAKAASLGDNGGSVTLYKDFGAATLGDASAVLIKDLMVAGKLSLETGLKELQRRGELAPDVDVDAEMDRIDQQGPPLGMIQPAAGPQGGPEPAPTGKPAPAGAPQNPPAA